MTETNKKYKTKKKVVLLFHEGEFIHRWIDWNVLEIEPLHLHDDLEINGYKEIMMLFEVMFVFKNLDSDYEYCLYLMHHKEFIVCHDFNDYLKCLKALEPLLNTSELCQKVSHYITIERELILLGELLGTS